MEIWKDIKDYEGFYQVSSVGRVRSMGNGGSNNSKERILKPYKNEYLMVNLFKNGKRTPFLIHRLVAEAFIPNIDNKPFIDHIDTNPSNNKIENLRWVTQKENLNNPLTINKFKSRIGKLHPKHKSILQFDKNMNFIKKWDCARDIERELGFNNSCISDCCNGKIKTSNGYKWGFETEYELIPFKVFDLKIYRKKVA